MRDEGKRYDPYTAAAIRANRLQREKRRRRRQIRRWCMFFGILAVFAAAAGLLVKCTRLPRTLDQRPGCWSSVRGSRGLI